MSLDVIKLIASLTVAIIIFIIIIYYKNYNHKLERKQKLSEDGKWFLKIIFPCF